MLYLYSFVGYLDVSCSGSITSVICLLSFTGNYVVSTRRGFLFLWMLGMGCVILLWHSLSLPYNNFSRFDSILSSPDSEFRFECKIHTKCSGQMHFQSILHAFTTLSKTAVRFVQQNVILQIIK